MAQLSVIIYICSAAMKCGLTIVWDCLVTCIYAYFFSSCIYLRKKKYFQPFAKLI